jgi:hypothetical protein
MRLELRSIDHGPVALPMWHAILEDLSHPQPRRVARVLGVSLRTVYRWNSTGDAPRVALLALFWLTRWGQSLVHTNASNDAVVAVQVARSLTDQLKALKLEVDQLRALGAPGGVSG